MNIFNRSAQQNPQSSILLIFICLGSVVALWWIFSTVVSTPREIMQNKLAEELGVDIQDYPNPVKFPNGYFDMVLKPGMPMSTVHEIVRGYKKVLRCKNSSEIYYYLSAEIEQTERFEIVYDNQYKYVLLRGEDHDSRTIWIEGCTAGRIEEE